MIPTSEEWRDRAYCRTAVDPDVFFPSENDRAGGLKVIKDYCSRCLVTGQCLEEGLNVAVFAGVVGVWGGLMPNQVRAIMRQQKIKSEHGTRYRFDKGCHCFDCAEAKSKYNREEAIRHRERRVSKK